MTAFLGISVWITLAMVIPGLVTLATIYGSFLAAGTCSAQPAIVDIKLFSEWAAAGVAVTVMIMTQAFGILLESVLVHRKWLGAPIRQITIPPGIDPLGLEKFELKPYEEYQGLYLLLAELRENEDPHGHLQRALAQFFLSNNTIISFLAGISAILWQMMAAHGHECGNAYLYLVLLCICLIITGWVSTIRFEVMTKALWATRRRRLKETETAMNTPSQNSEHD